MVEQTKKATKRYQSSYHVGDLVQESSNCEVDTEMWVWLSKKNMIFKDTAVKWYLLKAEACRRCAQNKVLGLFQLPKPKAFFHPFHSWAMFFCASLNKWENNRKRSQGLKDDSFLFTTRDSLYKTDVISVEIMKDIVRCMGTMTHKEMFLFLSFVYFRLCSWESNYEESILYLVSGVNYFEGDMQEKVDILPFILILYATYNLQFLLGI